MLDGAEDVDATDVLNVDTLINTGGDDSGIMVVGNTLSVDPSAYNSLADGETEVITYDYDIVDGNGGSVAQMATITITGANDAPVISVGMGDSDAALLPETDSALMASGTLTVTDVDTTDIVTASLESVATGGDDTNPPAPDNATLLAMLTVSPLAILSGTETTNPLTWSFNSSPEVFDYLAEGDSLELFYIVKVVDDNGISDTHTVMIEIAGSNDAPEITLTGSDSAAETLLETDASLMVSGSLTVSDVDVTDVVMASVPMVVESGDVIGAPSNAALLLMLTVVPETVLDGTQTEAGLFWTFESGSEAFDYLADGESLVLTYDVRVEDDNGAPAYDIQTVTITITGTNDAPVIDAGASTLAGEATEIADGAMGENMDTHMAAGSIAFEDLDLSDTHTSSFDPQATGYRGMFAVTTPTTTAMTTTGMVDWTFDVDDADLDDLAEGEVLTQLYDVTIADGMGGSDMVTVTITITGTNDEPTVMGAVTAMATEDDMTFTVNLLGGASDDDATDVLTVANLINTGGDETGVDFDNLELDGTVDVDPNDYNHLAVGESEVITYSYDIVDGNGGSVPQTATITITGVNDLPVISVEIGDDDDASLTESDLSLMATGTLTVTDVDITDIVTASVDAVITGGDDMNPPAPANAVLKAMLTVDPLLILNGNETSKTLDWSFNSSPEVFDYLAQGDSLELYYTVKVVDDNGALDTHTVMIEITGTNDAPEITLTAGDSAAETLLETDAGLMVSGSLTVSDVDVTDVVTASVPMVAKSGDVMGAPSDAALLLMLTVVPETVLDGTQTEAGLFWTFDSGSEAFDHLADGESLVLTYTVKVEDDNVPSGMDTQTITITIEGTNEKPDIRVDAGDSDAAMITETEYPDPSLTASGTLTVEDLDITDVVTAAVISVTTDGDDSDPQTPNNTELLNLLTVAPTLILDDTQTINTLTWTFDSSPEDFDYLEFGEYLELTYTIQAQDDNLDSDTQTVTITINGVNDKPDVDDQAFAINENKPSGTVVGTVAASDAEQDTLTFAITAGNDDGFFAIDSMTGEITTTQKLNHEDDDQHLLTVEVTDDGTPVLSDTAIVTIDVGDVNEKPKVNNQTFNLDEDDDESIIVGTVVATDPDDPTEPFGTLTYTIIAGNDDGLFVIDAMTGEITAPGGLDHEYDDQHILTVKVTDGGMPGLSDTALITINVDDKNEKPEDFSLSSTTVYENAYDGALVGILEDVADEDVGDSHSFSLIDDAGGRFELTGPFGAKLRVADGTQLNFESETSHQITVRVTDSGGLFHDKSFTIDVTDLNEAPTDVALSGHTVVENATSGTVIGMLQNVVDEDAGDTHSFALVDDAGGRFELVGSVLQVADYADLNFEYATSHEITVRVTDSGGLTLFKTFTIDVTDVNEAPSGVGVSSYAVTENAANNTVVGTLYGVIDPDAGDTHTFNMIDSAGGRFKIVGDEVKVANGGLLDYEAATSHAITVRVTDAAGLYYDKTITIGVTDEIFEAPTDFALSNTTVDEDTPNETIIGTLHAVADQNAGDSHSFTLLNDAGGRFGLTGAIGQKLWVADTALLDFEVATSHAITVRVTDDAGLTFDKTFTIDVADVNEAPTDVSLSATIVGEDAVTGTVVGTLQNVVDDAGDTHTFSLLAASGGRFELVGNELRVADASLIDFESATSHAINVRVTDAAGLFYNEAFTIDVTDVNEAPTSVALSSGTIAEDAANGTVVGTLLNVMDQDVGDTHTFGLVDDAAGRFQLVGDELRVADTGLLDFESAANHAVTVRVTDAGGLSYDRTFTINLTDTNEAPTDVALSANSIAEDAASGTFIGKVQDVVDPDAGDAHTFSLVDDAGGRFTLVAADGSILRVDQGVGFDFETDQSHDITVRVTDSGGLFLDKDFTIDVIDVNEAPTGVVLSASTIAEDAATDTVVGTLGGIIDPDAGDTHTFSLVNDAGGRFKLVGNALQVADAALLDFESATSHAVMVQVTDAAGLFHNAAFTIDVTDTNEAPTGVALSAGTIAEDAANGTIVGTLLNVADQDAGDTHTLSLLDDAGGRFELVGAELRLADTGLLDFESAANHAVTVRVTDAGGLSYDRTFTIDVTDVNEAPTDFAMSANVVAEGAAVNTIVGTLQGIVDPDAGDTHAFSLVDNAGGRFKIVGSDVQVAAGAQFDFEGASSHTITVRVTDAAGLFHDKSFTIDVVDMNEAPTDVALSANTVAETAATDTVVGMLQGVVDPDAGDTHTLSLIDDAGGRFKLVGDALQVADSTLLDFEGAVSHAVTVRVTDAAGLSLDKAFTIDVTDVNEAPTDVTLSANAVAEGAATDTVIGTFQDVVDDAGDTHTFSLVNDAGGRFKLVGAELRVADGALLDYETATSHAAAVQVTDADGLYFFRAFTVDVTNVNETPTGFYLSTNAVAEDAAADTVVGTLQDVHDPDAGDTHTFSLIDDAGGRFKLVGTDIQVTDGSLLDFESATDHTVTVRVTDAGGLFYDRALTIDVTDINEAPTGVALSTNTVAEGTAADTVVGMFESVVDPDAGDGHTFSLLDDAGGRFKLVGAELQVLDGALLDFEGAASHTVTVLVTDSGGLTYDETFTIDVTDANEAPTDVTLSTSTVAEGAAANTVVGTLQNVADPDAGDSHTFSLANDADGRFQIVGNELQVVDGALLDFENAASHTVVVQVTDAGGLSSFSGFTIDVTNVNEAPTGLVLSASTVAEGAAADTAIGMLQGVIDPDAGAGRRRHAHATAWLTTRAAGSSWSAPNFRSWMARCSTSRRRPATTSRCG